MKTTLYIILGLAAIVAVLYFAADGQRTFKECRIHNSETFCKAEAGIP